MKQGFPSVVKLVVLAAAGCVLMAAPLFADAYLMNLYDLGGGLSSNPTIASAPNSGRLEFFARGPGDALWWKRGKFADGDIEVLADWVSLGGGLTSDPDCAAATESQIYCAVRGPDNGLWIKAWEFGAWTEWVPLGGALGSGPTMTSVFLQGSGTIQLQVFVRGPNETLWRRSYNSAWGGITDPNVWSKWTEIPGIQFQGDPDCVAGFGQIDCVVRGLDNQIWHNSGTLLPAGTAWENLDGTPFSDPTIAEFYPFGIYESFRSFGLSVFVIGPGDELWVRHSDGKGWNDWSKPEQTIPAGTSFSSSPDCVAKVSGDDLFQTWCVLKRSPQDTLLMGIYIED